MCLIIEPLSFVDISVRMNEPTSSIGHIVFPVALILAAVLPDLDTPTVTKSFFSPLALINGSIIKLIRLSLDKFKICILTCRRSITIIVKGA
jgi:hypothetical protein